MPTLASFAPTPTMPPDAIPAVCDPTARGGRSGRP